MTIKSLSDTDFLLSVLADGEWHELNEIIDTSRAARGHGLTCHSRAADLRARGHRVDTMQRRNTNGRTDSFYKLVTLDEATGDEVPSLPSPPGCPPGSRVASSSVKQRSLFEAIGTAPSGHTSRGVPETSDVPGVEARADTSPGKSGRPDKGRGVFVCHVDESGGVA